MPYNDIANINYSLLPEAMGCNINKVTNINELKEDLKVPRKNKTGVFIEVITYKYNYGLL